MAGEISKESSTFIYEIYKETLSIQRQLHNLYDKLNSDDRTSLEKEMFEDLSGYLNQIIPILDKGIEISF